MNYFQISHTDTTLQLTVDYFLNAIPVSIWSFYLRTGFEWFLYHQRQKRPTLDQPALVSFSKSLTTWFPLVINILTVYLSSVSSRRWLDGTP